MGSQRTTNLQITILGILSKFMRGGDIYHNNDVTYNNNDVAVTQTTATRLD